MRRLAVPLGVGLAIVLAVAFAVVRGFGQPEQATPDRPAAVVVTTSTPNPSNSGVATPSAGPAPAVEPRESGVPDIIEPEMPAPVAPAGWTTAVPLTSAGSAGRESSGGGPPALQVASLGIRAPMAAAEVVAGEYAVPRDPRMVGAYRGSGGDLAARLAPRPGVLLVAGHLTVGRERGSLWPLHTLAPGAELVTIGPQGARKWRAVRMDIHRADALPVDLTQTTGPERLVVVTCTGPVITTEGRRAYRDNLVVTAMPA